MKYEKQINLSDLLKISPWGYELNNDEEAIIDNGKEEILTIYKIDDKYKLSYFSFSKEVAEETFKDCPEQLEEWKEKAKELKDIIDYKPIPYFTGTFNQDEFIEVYFFLISKMEKEEIPEDNIN